MAIVPVIAGVLVAAIGLWAAWATISDQPPTESPDFRVTYTVAEETVERSLPVIVVAERASDPIAVNHLQGVITHVADIHGPVPAGTIVYAVAGLPVRIVEGDVPFYRDLAPGLEGEDVSQLQVALVELGYMDARPDGHFGASTSAAVSEWRRELGLTDRDTVALGELIAVPGLPRLVRIADGISLGMLATVGSDAIFVLGDQPTFELPLTDAQAQAIDPAATVVVAYGDMEWKAKIATSQAEADQGQVVFTLSGLGGGSVCGQECDALPPEERLQLRGRVVSVPPTTGPAVPVAALETDAQGRVSVWLESGVVRPVTVLATAGGIAIVDGVSVGERVLLVGGPNSDGDG